MQLDLIMIVQKLLHLILGETLNTTKNYSYNTQGLEIAFPYYLIFVTNETFFMVLLKTLNS